MATSPRQWSQTFSAWLRRVFEINGARQDEEASGLSGFLRAEPRHHGAIQCWWWPNRFRIPLCDDWSIYGSMLVGWQPTGAGIATDGRSCTASRGWGRWRRWTPTRRSYGETAVGKTTKRHDRTTCKTSCKRTTISWREHLWWRGSTSSRSGSAARRTGADPGGVGRRWNEAVGGLPEGVRRKG